MKKLILFLSLFIASFTVAQLNIMPVGKQHNCPGIPDTLMAVGDTAYTWFLTDQPDSILSTESIVVVMRNSSYNSLHLSVASPTDTAEYVYWSNAANCFCDAYVPNRFTPDGDLFNEYFYAVINCGDIQGVRMTIYNRMGKIVFDETDYYAPRWNGRLNNEGIVLRDDVYGWLVSFIKEDGEIVSLSGHVSLSK